MGLLGSTSSRRSALLALFFVASSVVVSAEFPEGFSCKESKDGVTGSAARYISAKPGVKDKVQTGPRGEFGKCPPESGRDIGKSWCQSTIARKKAVKAGGGALSQGTTRSAHFPSSSLFSLPRSLPPFSLPPFSPSLPLLFLTPPLLLPFKTAFKKKKKKKTGRVRRPLRRQLGLHELHLLRRRRPGLRQRLCRRAPDPGEDVHARRRGVQARQGPPAAGREAGGV